MRARAVSKTCHQLANSFPKDTFQTPPSAGLGSCPRPECVWRQLWGENKKTMQQVVEKMQASKLRAECFVVKKSNAGTPQHLLELRMTPQCFQIIP